MNTSSRCSCLISSLSTCTKILSRSAQQSRPFSSTPQNAAPRTTRQRRAMYRWLQTQGENFRGSLEGSTNYLSAYNAQGQLKRVVAANSMGDSPKTGKEDVREGKTKDKALPSETSRDLMPFPMNNKFISQPVLDEELREIIWTRIMKEAKSVRQVSAELRVEMSRVGAVVRLKEVEKEWQRVGKPFARPYAEAVMKMLPKTTLDPKSRKAHESITDLPIHASTGPQIFHPTSESRHFTRVDAAKVFDEDLLPADDRIPHPQLIEMHKDIMAGMSLEERTARQEAREDAENERRERAAVAKAKREAKIKRVDTGRWEYRFTEVNVDDIGKDGRGHRGTGWRYGTPLMDRSRAQVKIPTKVE